MAIASMHAFAYLAIGAVAGVIVGMGLSSVFINSWILQIPTVNLQSSLRAALRSHHIQQIHVHSTIEEKLVFRESPLKHDSTGYVMVGKHGTLNSTIDSSYPLLVSPSMQVHTNFSSIVFVVLLNTCRPHFVRVVQETWGKDVTRLVILLPSNCKIVWQPTANVHVVHISLNKLYSNWELYYSAMQHLSLNQQQWFMLVPVNIYTHTANLERLLSSLQSAGKLCVSLTDELGHDTTKLQAVLFNQQLLQDTRVSMKSCLQICATLSCYGTRICIERVITNFLTQCKAHSSEYKLKSISYKECQSHFLTPEKLSRVIVTEPMESPYDMFNFHLFFKISLFRNLQKRKSHLKYVISILKRCLTAYNLNILSEGAPSLLANSSTLPLKDPITSTMPPTDASSGLDMFNVQAWSYFDNQSNLYASKLLNPQLLMSMYKMHQYETQLVLLETVRDANKKSKENLVFKGYTGGYLRHGVLGNEYIINGIFSRKGRLFNEVIHLFRPFTNRYLYKGMGAHETHTVVNFVVPFSGSRARLDTFLITYKEQFLETKENTSLTLAVQGGISTNYVRTVVNSILQQYPTATINIVKEEGTFSRAIILNSAMMTFNTDDLVFLCDVDLIVDRQFATRCRENTAQGLMVYSPEFFKLYNKDFALRTNHNKVPINRQTGHWAFYSYGMLCIYKSDYDAVGGFDTSLRGWGGEDVLLLNRILNHGLEVFRAPDPGLMHRWHQKVCKTTDNQYQECLWSKSENLADKQQLARLIFDMEQNQLHCAQSASN